MTLEEYTEQVQEEINILYESEFDLTGYEQFISEAYDRDEPVKSTANEIYMDDCSNSD